MIRIKAVDEQNIFDVCKLTTNQNGTGTSMEEYLIVEVRPFKVMISGYRLPLPRKRCAIPQRESPLTTVYSR